MSHTDAQEQGWKSHFSLASLLPARHPPLHVNHPPLPTLPTQRVAAHHHTTDTLQCPSPIRSAYASPSVYPETPFGPMSALPIPLPPLRHQRRARSPSPPPAQVSPTKAKKHRPPPLDLARIKATYPTERAVNDAAQPDSDEKGSLLGKGQVSPPILPPLKRNRADQGATSSTGNRAGMDDLSRWAALAEARNQLEGGSKKAEKEETERGAIKKPRRAERVSDDPFDVAVVEPGLQYPSWHAPVQPYAQPARPSDLGREHDFSNLKPGEVVPRHLLDSYKPHADRDLRETVAGETYESVLHNVLLTPTYMRDTPSPRSQRSGLVDTERSGNGRYARLTRETLLAKAKRASRAPFAMLAARRAEPSDARSVSSSMRAMREREEAEMDKFRRTKGVMLGSTTSLPPHSSPDKGREMPTRRSPTGERGRGWGFEDEEAKVEYHQHAYYTAGPLPSKQALKERDERDNKARGSCWTFNITKRMDPKKVKKQQRKRKICIVILILLLVGAVVGICLALLLRRPMTSASSTSHSSAPSSTSGNTIGASTGAAASPTSSAASSNPSTPSPSITSTPLQVCIDQYRTLGSDTSSYPCSECVPLLLGAPNDFTAQDPSSSNGSAGGVGAALQFCTLRDVVNAGDANAFGVGDGGLGWGERDVCRWRGIKCDSRGRVEELILTYPAVPHRIPTTISQIPTLKRIQITGNSSVPSGPFPNQLITSTLTNLQLTDTALQGPIASAPWGDAKELSVLYLANNPILGSGVPNFKGNDKLVTLAMTGQLIGSVDVGANLPGSLTYLDLSYNSLSGQVPSFSDLPNLHTLYLEHNNLASPPPSLPSTLTDLRLNNNPSLAGSMPSQICGMSGLSECDLRGTGMGGNATRCGRCLFGSA